jgi:hypothetical protein
VTQRNTGSNRFGIVIALVAALAACVASAAALWQAAISRDTEYRQLRSYLYVTHGPLEQNGGTISVPISIRHSGLTPAFNVRIDTTATVGSSLLNDENLGDPTSMGGSDNKQIAILNGPDKFDYVASQSNQTALRIFNNTDRAFGEHVLYVHGVVRYQDIFGIEGHQPERRYEFCFVFRPAIDLTGSERGCEKFNRPG